MIDREQKYREMAMRGKYRTLYAHLCSLRSREWSTSFTEVEAVLGFQLPVSARMHRPWWANQSRGNGHSHALAWTTAGWETAHVDMEAETLLFRRKHPEPVADRTLDEVWPVHSAGAWPADLRGCVTIGFSPPFEPFPIQREGTQFAVIQVSPRDQEDLSHTL